MTLWEINVEPLEGHADLVGQGVRTEAADLGLAKGIDVRFVRGYLIQGAFDQSQVAAFTKELLADSVIEQATFGRVGAVDSSAANISAAAKW